MSKKVSELSYSWKYMAYNDIANAFR